MGDISGLDGDDLNSPRKGIAFYTNFTIECSNNTITRSKVCSFFIVAMYYVQAMQPGIVGSTHTIVIDCCVKGYEGRIP
jgi:hypothetical protein